MHSADNSTPDSTRDAVSKHWNAATHRERPERTMWWESRRIREHINRVVCGKPLPRMSQGLLELAKEEARGRTYALGVSVGCGIASKEITLLQAGLVQRFVLYELSGERIKKGQALAASKGLLDRMEFRSGDAFSDLGPECVDFVHWNNSLHHMMNVDDAVRWSRDVLRPGGMFYMDDFVGPTRWQWSDESLALAERARALLPSRYLRNPHFPTTSAAEFLSLRTGRPNAAKLAKDDPSEAADSGRILESVHKYFPDARIVPTGGVIYHLALRQILANFNEDDEQDRALLDALLLLDEYSMKQPGIDIHYAAALALKSGDAAVPDTPELAEALPHQCPVCEARIPGFRTFGVQKRPGAQCPACGALERHRVLWLFLQQETDLFQGSKRLLHVAPERLMSEKLQQIPGIRYLSGDLGPALAMVQMDLTDIRYPESAFDCILCSHVLEHIPDDRRAMREMLRVLAPGGWAIVMVPVHPGVTYEDFSITTEEGRLKAFGQKDHVRRYGADLAQRLSEAGFDVSVVDFAAKVPAELRQLYNLRRREIFFCRKP